MSVGYQLKSILGISALVSFYGIASLLVIFLGPSVGIPYLWEIIIIALLLLTWPFAVLIIYSRKRRARKRELAQSAAAESSPQTPVKASGAPKRIHEELSRAAEEAVQWLRSSRLSDSKSGNAVYALPWFVVSGPLASGKTSLALSCGLDFQTLPSQRRAEMRIVRPTRHCDWRITEAAVLLDSAGRYQGDGPAREEWLALNETLKKYRQGRALDGFLIVIDAPQIIQLGETEIEQLAKTLRARLDETIQIVRARFPAYLVFTHVDELSGFAEFFNDGKSAGEVWGATIPLEKSANAHALFDLEFDQLYESLVRRRLLRLSVSAKPGTQLKIFDFPHRFSATRDKLGLFTSALFRPNPFSESPLLRGFYFTATVPGKPRDKSAQPDGEERGPEAVGRSFFIDRFFKEVVLHDKNLAASFQESQQKPVPTKGILLTLATIIVLILLACAAVSFVANRKFIADATKAGEDMYASNQADHGKDVLQKDPTAAKVEIEKMEALRQQLAVIEAGPPWYMRFGLYGGNDLKPNLTNIFNEAVEQRFRKPTIGYLENDLRNFVADRPSAVVTPTSSTSDQPQAPTQDDILGRHYDLLKAYLMLSQPSRVEPTFLSSMLADYWKKTAPLDSENSSIPILEFYTRELVREDAPAIRLDDKLVSDVRQKLKAYPPVKRFYKRIVTEINAKTTSSAVSLDSILQEGGGGGVLVSTYTVPGSFTIDGYRNYMKSTIENSGAEISKDDWVMGADASSSQTQTTDASTLQSNYLTDYTDQWRKFLRGISVKPFKTREEAAAALKVLSDTNSPMDRVMLAVAKNTNLSKKPERGGILGWITGWFSSNSDEGGKTTVVETEFGPLFQFIPSAEKKDSPMSQYRSELKRLHDKLQEASDTEFQQSTQATLAGKDDFGLRNAEQVVGGLLDGFKTPAATDTATLLKKPLLNVRYFLYGGGNDLNAKIWAELIYPKAHELESGYPFTDSGETRLTDLVRFLNPVDGQFTQFFDKNLPGSFEYVQGQWKLKSSSPIRVSSEFESYVNNLLKLREALFPNKGQQPQVEYDLTVKSDSSSDVTIEIDGVSASTGHPSSHFTWPARSGSVGATITVLQNGATTPPKTFPGTWGLFKMIEAGSRGLGGGSQFDLAWNVGNTTVRATLRPASTNNPFQRSLFRNVHAPQNLQ
ncbi:MAG: type VI secretion system membrane subunit TssM [Blastocatellia bacterium]|nr:MAG: type VI secretion system membrane subunit TssM [Blastocatellia bacterium]